MAAVALDARFTLDHPQDPAIRRNMEKARAIFQAAMPEHRRRKLGLSLGDRACLALAKRRGSRTVTSDKMWMRLGSEVEIECIRR